MNNFQLPNQNQFDKSANVDFHIIKNNKEK